MAASCLLHAVAAASPFSPAGRLTSHTSCRSRLASSPARISGCHCWCSSLGSRSITLVLKRARGRASARARQTATQSSSHSRPSRRHCFSVSIKTGLLLGTQGQGFKLPVNKADQGDIPLFVMDGERGELVTPLEHQTGEDLVERGADGLERQGPLLSLAGEFVAKVVIQRRFARVEPGPASGC